MIDYQDVELKKLIIAIYLRQTMFKLYDDVLSSLRYEWSIIVLVSYMNYCTLQRADLTTCHYFYFDLF